MSDEKLSTAQRPPEKEEAAPAPASALGTATTSNDVTNDITTPHGDIQAITEEHIDEIPAQEGAPAPGTPGSDDTWRYACALINEFASEEDYRSGDFGREHTREPDPYAINQAPVAYSRKKDCARREGAAFADRLEYVFDELDDEMQAVVRDGARVPGAGQADLDQPRYRRFILDDQDTVHAKSTPFGSSIPPHCIGVVSAVQKCGRFTALPAPAHSPLQSAAAASRKSTARYRSARRC